MRARLGRSISDSDSITKIETEYQIKFNSKTLVEVVVAGPVQLIEEQLMILSVSAGV